MSDRRWSFAGACAALLAAFALGWWGGRTSVAPAIVAEREGPSAADTAAATRLAAATAAAPLDGEAPEAMDDGSEFARLVAAVIEDRSLAQAALRWGGDPTVAIANIVNQMSDRELIAAVSSISDFAGRDIKKAPDMRRYATRLSEIALGGITGEPSIGPGEIEIEFSTSLEQGNSAPDAQSRFGTEDGKIYAVFPNEDVPSGPVLVKWSRTDQPELLLFEQYSINRQRERSYVWFKPQEGFPPGEYQVDFYGSGGELDHLGAGTYSVDPP